MVVKWDPLREIEQTLDWWRTQPFRRPLWDDDNEQRASWVPAINVYEDTENLYVETQVPGVEMKDVTISVVDHTMEIRGERKLAHEDKKEGYHIREAQYGTFSRRINLPKYVNPNEAEAIYEKGVLIVKVPKQEDAKPKLIPIEAK